MAALLPAPIHHSPPALPHPALTATRGQQDSLETPKMRIWARCCSHTPLQPTSSRGRTRPPPHSPATPHPMQGKGGESQGAPYLSAEQHQASVPSSRALQRLRGPPSGPVPGGAARPRTAPRHPGSPRCGAGPPFCVCVQGIRGGGGGQPTFGCPTASPRYRGGIWGSQPLLLRPARQPEGLAPLCPARTG